MSSSLEPARRNLATAAHALDEFRRLSGAEDSGQPPLSNWRVPAEAGARAALDEARARLAELGAELDKVRRTAAAASDSAAAERIEAARAIEEAAALRARGTALEAEWAAARGTLAAGSAAARAELEAAEARAGRAENAVREAEEAARDAAEAWAARLELLERDALSTARAESSHELAVAKARAAAFEADLETARATAAALEAEASALREAAENRASSRADSAANADVAQRRAAAASSRVALLEAECVRLQSMRRSAEQSASDAEAQGRAVAEALRGELRDAHAALDRAAVQAGTAEARTKSEVEPILKRLEAATARIHALEREKRLESARGTGEASAIQTELLRAQAVSATLRQELAGVRAEEEALRREAAAAKVALELTVAGRPAELEQALSDARDAQARLAGLQGAAAALRQELSASRVEENALRRQVAEAQAAQERAVADRPAALERALADAQAAQTQLASLQMELLSKQTATAALREDLSRVRAAAAREADAHHRRLSEAQASFERTLGERTAELEKLGSDSKAQLEAVKAAAKAQLEAILPPPESAHLPPETAPSVEEPSIEPFVSPSLEVVLDTGWGRLLRLVRPPVDSAYAHLRRLSATPMPAGQKALLRMAAASIAQASDSLSSIELALAEGPAPGAPAPVAPVLEESINAWEAAFRNRGVALKREFLVKLPDASYDPKELRVALQHILRNTLEAVPRGGRLTLRAGRGPDGGLRLEFADDGPGFPAEWLEHRFEPFAAPRRGRAGLGLSIVRRTLRRWGGDVEASNAAPGRGARLILTFAPPAPPDPASK